MKSTPISEKQSEQDYLKNLDETARIEFILSAETPDEKMRRLNSALELIPDQDDKKAFNKKFIEALDIPKANHKVRGAPKTDSLSGLDMAASDNDLIAYLEELEEDDRMFCILGLDSPDEKIRVFNLVLGMLPDESSRNDFSERFNAKSDEFEELLKNQITPTSIKEQLEARMANIKSMGDKIKAKQETQESAFQQITENPVHPEQSEQAEPFKPAEQTQQELPAPDLETEKKVESGKINNEKAAASKVEQTPSKDKNAIAAKPVTEEQQAHKDNGNPDKKDKRDENQGKPHFSLFGPRINKELPKDVEPDISNWATLSLPQFRGPFTDFSDLFAEGNMNKMHDTASSIPYRGLVSPSGQLQFSLDQGEKLEEYLKVRNISPLNASPADREILKRAGAARREIQIQALDSSQYAMNEWERKLMESVSRFKRETLINALPEMMKADNAHGIKTAFNEALKNNLLDRESIKNSMQEISNDFINYHNSVAHHASNLIKDGQVEEATQLLTEFVKKSKEIGAEGFLNEINNEEFSKKIEELSNKMGEMIVQLIEKITGQTSPTLQWLR